MNRKQTAFLLLSFSLAGCNGPQEVSQIQPESRETATSASPANPSIMSMNLPTIQSGGQTVAYVAGLLDDGFFLVYIPEVDRYAYVDSQTGEYGAGANGIRHSLAGCTGVASADKWLGEVGKTVLFDGTSYYLVTGVYTKGQTITTLSNSSTTYSCSNSTTSHTTIQGEAQLTLTAKPFDFAAIAPLRVSF